MRIGGEKMGVQRNKGMATLAAAVVGVLTVGTASAETLVWDTAGTSGFQLTSGTWDFNNTANWSTDGTTLVPWSSNTDTARFQLSGTTSGLAATIAATPQVGAMGLEFAGSLSQATRTWTLDGNKLQLGAGGIDYTVTNATVIVNAPLELTASQTWRSNKNQADLFKVTGPISSAPATTTNLTFDGQNIGNAVSLTLAGANTFSGSTTVTNRGLLKLDYTTQNNSKLDDNSALIIGGGSEVRLLGIGAGTHTDVVASTTLKVGANKLSGPSNNTTTYAIIDLGTITREVGALLDFGGSGMSRATNPNSPSTGLPVIGGWATAFGTGWARKDNTDTTLITTTNGNSRSSSSAWVANLDNVSATASESNIGSKTINTLRLASASVTLNFAPGATLQLNSGGIITASTGQSITGGNITTGMSTGELFIHAPSASTVGSAIVNNGLTPTILVKGGSDTLTLTGDSTYTGKTFVNAGTLLLDDGGSLANGNIDILAGATLAGGTTGDGGTITFNIDGNTADRISITEGLGGGRLDLTNLTLALDVTGTQTLSEFVLADKAVGSSYVLGSSFFNTILPANWAIDYDGTDANPDSIVLTVVPEPSTLAAVSVLALGWLSRRRRM